MTRPAGRSASADRAFSASSRRREIYAAALRILADIGMQLHHDEAQATHAGRRLHARRRRPRARACRRVVDAARADAPASVTMLRPRRRAGHGARRLQRATSAPAAI